MTAALAAVTVTIHRHDCGCVTRDRVHDVRGVLAKTVTPCRDHARAVDDCMNDLWCGARLHRPACEYAATHPATAAVNPDADPRPGRPRPPALPDTGDDTRCEPAEWTTPRDVDDATARAEDRYEAHHLNRELP